MSSYRVGFVLEHTLGHVTVAHNLRKNVAADRAVHAAWFPIAFDAPSPLQALPLVGNNWSLRASYAARDALRQAGAPRAFDALYFHTQVTALLAAGMLRRTAGLLSLDATPKNYDAVGLAYGHGRGPEALERIKDLLNRRAFRAASALVTFSDWARDSLICDYGVPSAKVTTLPPGTNLDLWESNRPSRDAAADVRLLFVGGDFRRKGGELLLDVFRHTLAGTCELDIVSNAPLPPLPAGVRAHRGLTANSDPLRRLFAEADIFVLPTLADCLANVLTEAMAARLPIVTTDVGALGEAVHDGENGYLVAPGDAAALGAALRRLVADPELRRRMGDAGRRIAEKRFDAQVNSRRLLDLIKEQVDRRRQRAAP